MCQLFIRLKIKFSIILFSIFVSFGVSHSLQYTAIYCNILQLLQYIIFTMVILQLFIFNKHILQYLKILFYQPLLDSANIALNLGLGGNLKELVGWIRHCRNLALVSLGR